LQLRKPGGQPERERMIVAIAYLEADLGGRLGYLVCGAAEGEG
jgi:hypothetical protein